MPYPDNTTPDYKDSELETLKEMQRILNDAKTGAAPLLTSGRVVGPFRVVLASTATALDSTACSGVIFTNTIGEPIFIRRGTDDPFITIPNNSGMEFDVLANANELTVETESGSELEVTYQCVGEAVA